MKCHECNSDEHLVSQCPLKGKGKGGGSPSMVNFWSTGTSADQGSGSQQADAPQSAFTASRLQAAERPTETSPPWLSEDLLYEPPMTTSLGYVQTPYPMAGHGDHAAAFPAFSEQDESCASDPNGGLSMTSSHRDPLQSTDPWAGQSTAAAPGPPPVSVLRGMWERWRPSASSVSNRVPRSYGPARTPQRAHSAPAEARASPIVQWHTPAEMETMLRNAPSNTPPVATPAWSTWSSEHHAVREPASLGEAVTLPPVGGGTTPVEPGGLATALTMVDIQRALYGSP